MDVITKKIFDGAVVPTIGGILGNAAKHLAKVTRSTWDASAVATAAGGAAQDLERLRSVRTIYHPDKLDLLDFYYPLRLSTHDEHSFTPKGLSDLIQWGPVLVEGTAGQGKSILMRYICSAAIVDATFLPLFIELRTVTPDTSVTDLITVSLKTYRIRIHENSLDTLLHKGFLALFFDGLDEVSSKCSAKVSAELDQLAQDYPDTPIVVSSRPEESLSFSPHYKRLKVDYLVEEDVEPLVIQLMQGNEHQDGLLQNLGECRHDIISLLNTPLMVTLLVCSYESRQVLPNEFREFFERLFPLVWERHDQAKLNFDRERRCSLSPDDMRRMFCAYSFVTANRGATSVSISEARSFVGEASGVSNVSVDADAFLADIRSITNFLVKDGNRLAFLHRTLQEFHAACLLRDTKELHHLRAFYKQVQEKHRLIDLKGLIGFLSQIDQARFCSEFLSPMLRSETERILRRPITKAKVLSSRDVERLLSLYSIAIYDSELHGGSGFTPMPQNDPHYGEGSTGSSAWFFSYITTSGDAFGMSPGELTEASGNLRKWLFRICQMDGVFKEQLSKAAPTDGVYKTSISCKSLVGTDTAEFAEFRDIMSDVLAGIRQLIGVCTRIVDADRDAQDRLLTVFSNLDEKPGNIS